MSRNWRPVPADLLAPANRIAGRHFRYVETLATSRIPELTPVAARHLLESMAPQVKCAWAAISSAEAAQVAYGDPGSWPAGGVLEAELLLDHAVSLRLGPVEDGSLTLWAYGPDLAPLADTGIWSDPDIMSGLLAQTRQFLSVRGGGAISYDIFWQIAGEFGLRERLALLTGIEG